MKTVDALVFTTFVRFRRDINMVLSITFFYFLPNAIFTVWVKANMYFKTQANWYCTTNQYLKENVVKSTMHIRYLSSANQRIQKKTSKLYRI